MRLEWYCKLQKFDYNSDMESDEQRSLYEKLDLINRQKPDKTSSSAKLWKLLQLGWRSVSSFMTYKFESRTQPSNDVWWYGYGWKARNYAYLPAIEEERDWLEKIYSQRSDR